MGKKRFFYILLFLAGALLSIFWLEMPALGYKNIEYVESTSSYHVTHYSWYGKQLEQKRFEGDTGEALEIFQNQSRIQTVQAILITLSFLTILSILFREKRLYRYGSAGLTFLLVIAHILLVKSMS